MMVEFIGCTGSGKTTLIRQVQSRLAATTHVVTAHELVGRRIGLGGVTNPTAQNLLQELVGLPYCLSALGRHRAFIEVTIRLFSRQTPLSIATIQNLRSLERKLGVYELVRRSAREAIVLVDEGPIQATHMFAFAAAPPTAAEMARFAQLLPLPDLVVYVRSSVATLDARTRRRADPPRQINAQHGAWREAYIRAAVALFDALVQSAPLRDRCLIVENPDCTRPEYDALVDGLAQAILNRRPLPRRPGLAPPRSSAPWETYAQANPPAH